MSIYLYLYVYIYILGLCKNWENENKSMPLGYLMPGQPTVIVMHEKHQQQKELLSHGQAQIRSLNDRGFNMFQQVARWSRWKGDQNPADTGVSS
jgi:hypothetical protein